VTTFEKTAETVKKLTKKIPPKFKKLSSNVMKLSMKNKLQKMAIFFSKNKIQHKEKLVRSLTLNIIFQFYFFMLRGCENSPRKNH